MRTRGDDARDAEGARRSAEKAARRGGGRRSSTIGRPRPASTRPWRPPGPHKTSCPAIRRDRGGPETPGEGRRPRGGSRRARRTARGGREGRAQAGDSSRSSGESLDQARVEMRRREADVRKAKGAIAAAGARLDALLREQAEAADELTTLLGNRFEMAQIKPLTPEQLCWSMLKVTGVYDRTEVGPGGRAEQGEAARRQGRGRPAAQAGPRARDRAAHPRQAQGRLARVHPGLRRRRGPAPGRFLRDGRPGPLRRPTAARSTPGSPRPARTSPRRHGPRARPSQGRRGPLSDHPLPAARPRRNRPTSPGCWPSRPRTSRRWSSNWSGGC